MDVVVYSKPFFPSMGGLERNTLTLSTALGDLGHDVELITETLEESTDDFPFPVTRCRSLKTIFGALSDADLLIVNGNVSLRVHPLAWIRQVPYAVVYHNYRGYRRQGEGLSVTVENALRGAVAGQAMANVFTNTFAAKRSGLQEESIHVVLNPVDKRMQELYNGCTSGRRHPDAPFLFAGRIIEGKGIFVLARALEILDGEVEIRVVIAGEGRDQDRLREQVQGFSTIQVDLVGRLDAAELVEQYRQARALVVPSTTHKEGNPLVIAESIYAGTPVIASDQPPMVESVQGAGIIVEQGNERELAEGIHDMWGDADLYATKQKRAENRASLFGYGRYRQQIRKIFGTGDQERTR